MTPRLTIQRTILFSLIAVFLILALLRFVPLRAQSYSGLTSPASGAYLAGRVKVKGTADLDNFWKYELAYKQEPSGEDAFGFLMLAEQPVINGVLAVWDVSGLPPGIYSLRLRVVKDDANYLEFYASDLYVNLPKPPVFVLPLPLPPPKVASQSQPPRAVQLPTSERGNVAIDRLLPSPNYARDHTLYALGEGLFLRSLDDGASWQFAAELEGAPLDWSQTPVALAKRSPGQIELLLTTPSLLANPFSPTRNRQRSGLTNVTFADDSPYSPQGNLFAIDPTTFTWRDFNAPRWFVGEPWLLTHNPLGDLWATRLSNEATLPLLTQDDLQNLVGATPFLLLRAIPSPTGDAVALVIDTVITEDPDQAVGLLLLVLSLRDGNLRVVAPLQKEGNPAALLADAETYVANRNMAVTMGSVTWAHDGQQFAFASAYAGHSADLYRFHLPTASIYRLSDEASSVERIDWSPDDRLLLYTVRHRHFADISRSPVDLYVANADGSGYRRLFNDNVFNTKLLEWTGEKSALIYNEVTGASSSCNLQALRKITVAPQADVGHTVFITETQVITDFNTNLTFTQEIQVPILVTTTEELVLSEVISLTTEQFQAIGYSATSNEFLLADGFSCSGINSPGMYRLRFDGQPPQRIADPVYATRLQPLADGRWLIQDGDAALGYLGNDNQITPIAPFTDTLPTGEVATLHLSAIIGDQWLWRLRNDSKSEFWIAAIGSTPQRLESPPLRDIVTNVEDQLITLAGINGQSKVTIFRYPSDQEEVLDAPNQVSALQLITPQRPQIAFERVFASDRWSITPLPTSAAQVDQLLPSPNYAVDGTLYLLGERTLLRTTDRGKSWAQLANTILDTTAPIWLTGVTQAENPLIHRLWLASKQGDLLQIDPARQLWTPLLPFPDWVRSEEWMLVSSADSLWALRSDGSELSKLASVESTFVVDPNPQDTIPATSPFAKLLRSPDGKWLAFTVNINFSISPSPVPVLYLLSLEDGSLRSLAALRLPYDAATFTTPDDIRTSLDTPGMVWSSNSRKLAFVREQTISGTDLFVHDVENGETTRLSEEVGNAYQLRWSPDNRYVVFTSAYSFGTGESYAMSGAWAADVLLGTIQSLYPLPPVTTAEEISGWLKPDTVLINSRHPLCGSLYLRAVDLAKGNVTPLVPGIFSRVETNPDLQSALAIALPAQAQCLALFVAITSPEVLTTTGGAPTLPNVESLALLQSDVITPGIYHTHFDDEDALLIERVGGDLAGIDEGQTAAEFESLKATLLVDSQAVPLETVQPAPNLGWTFASFFDNGADATIQTSDAQGQQQNFQSESVKQLVTASNGQNVFVLAGGATLRLQALRYPVPRLEASSMITQPLGLVAAGFAIAQSSAQSQSIPVYQSLQIEERLHLPVLDGRLLSFTTVEQPDKATLYLASERSLWRSADAGKSWELTNFPESSLVRSPVLVESGETSANWLALSTADEQLTTLDPTRGWWRLPGPNDSWLATETWQLLVGDDALWALRRAGDSLVKIASVPISESDVITAGVAAFYQISPAPDQQRIAWLAPTASFIEGTQAISMAVRIFSVATQKVETIANLRLPTLEVAKNEKLLAWSTDGDRLAFVSSPVVEEVLITDTQEITSEVAFSENVGGETQPLPSDVVPVEATPATGAIGIFDGATVRWRNLNQGFPVNPLWSPQGALVYGTLDAFSVQRPLLAIYQLDRDNGEAKLLVQRPPEIIDETMIGLVEGERLIVQSQHPSCGTVNLRMIDLATGETIPIWAGTVRYSQVRGQQILVMPSLLAADCNFGALIETSPTINLYELSPLTATLLASISDPVQGVLGGSGASIWISTLDPQQVTQINWGEGTIITRSLKLPVAISTFQQTLFGDQHWVGWNPGRSVLWLGDFKNNLEGLPTPLVRQAWWSEQGALATFDLPLVDLQADQGLLRTQGIVLATFDGTPVVWVDGELAVKERIEIGD